VAVQLGDVNRGSEGGNVMSARGRNLPEGWRDRARGREGE
jgi:hypothetical protein